MAISSSDITAGPYTTNGATTNFSFSFRVADYGDVEAEDMVKVTLVTIATGAETVLTRGSSAGQYTVAVNGDQDLSPGGSITTVTTYGAGYYIWIRLKPTFVQATELQNQGSYNASVVEDQFDEMTRQILDLKDQLRRAPVAGIQIGESFSGEITGTPTAGYIPVLNSGLTGYDWVANNGSSNLVTATGSSTARTLADWFQGIERGSVLAPSGGDLFTAQGANFWRNGERALFGGYATAYKGTNDKADGASFLGTTAGGFNAFWQERSAQLASLSLHGGIGVLGGSRKSDRYIYTDGVTYPVWITSTVYAAGAIVGANGKFYQTATGGTSGGTRPSHTSGDASDGAVTWTFLGYSYTTPIGVAGVVLNDIVDAQAAWAGYFEAVRTSLGGTTYALEIDVGNEGADVVTTPYSVAAAGATIGLWIAAGRSASTPANPSSTAIAIGANGQTWNTGINFQATGITTGGYAMKMAAIAAHQFGWFNSSGEQVSVLRSAATANNERTQLLFGDRKIELYAVGGVMATFQSDAAAGTAADEHINLKAQAAGTGYADITANGAASTIALRIYPKGSDNLQLGGLAVRPITDDGSSLGNASARWSDLFLASGAVINFAAGNVTITHATGALAIAGGEVTLSSRALFSNGTCGLELNSTQPLMRWTDTDSGSNEKTWDALAAGTTFLMRTRTDAYGAGATWLTVTRSGTTVSSIAFGAGVSDPVARLQALPRSTTAALAAIGNAINTTNKFANKAVINTTTGAIVTAADATAGGVWQALDGTTAHTPV